MSTHLSLNQRAPKFKGEKGEDIEVFLGKILAHIEWLAKDGSTIDDSGKAYIISQQLEGTAAKWVSPELRLHPTNLIRAGGTWKTLEEFLLYLQSNHNKYYAPKANAEKLIINILQGSQTAMSYNLAFATL